MDSPERKATKITWKSLRTIFTADPQGMPGKLFFSLVEKLATNLAGPKCG